MSLKDLFNNLNSSIISSGSANKIAAEIESADYLQSYSKLRDKLRPHTDFTKPENFAKFGSAEKYYVDAIERIYKTYPYDGSLQEKIQWELSSSGIDLYMFDKEYPRTNGFANFVVAPGETGAEGTYFFPSSGDDEYITVKGGPNTSSRKKNKDVDDTSGDYKDGYANIYDLSNNRESNLKIDGTDGNTIEFWLKKDGWVDDAKGQDYFEFVFDTHVSGTVFGEHNYARFTVALATTGTVGNSNKKPILVRYYSGSSGDSPYLGSSTLTTASIADGKWHHYAVRVKTTGSNIIFDLFVDGAHNDSYIDVGTVDYVSGNTVAVVGAQAFSFFDGTAERGATGWSKLSGSLDEVRFWKTWRTAEQIGRQYIEPVGAGSNTDTANTDLGVYYKFNEGITLTSSVDSTVLDYSGRISNGTWVGYNSTQSRSTGSAIVLSGKAEREFKDPILYSFHPEVQDLVSKKTNIGKEYDYRNANSIYNSMPAWVTELDNTKNSPPLKNLTQIIANYFDTLSNEIENITKLKEVSYASGSLSNFDKPFFFNDRILQGSGFPYIPELFSDASFFEFFRNRSNTKLFEEKLYDVKNTIYRNIYNNLVYINKSKGTEKAFRNMLRCFGFDDEIYKIRYYATDAVHDFRDNYKAIVENKNYVNFALTASSVATVYQYQTDSNTTSFISASYSTTGAEASGFAFTAESQVVFPIIGTEADHNTLIKSQDRSSVYKTQDFVTDKEASLFGIRSVNNGPASQENDMTVPTNDRTGFVVKVVRETGYEKRAYFKLEPTDTTSYFPTITSSYFEDVFDNTKWNFAVVVQPERYGQFDTVTGSGDSATYDVIFYGVNSALDDVRNSFALSSSISKAYGQTILSTPKRFFAGALRENITGSLEVRSNAFITDCRFWQAPLSFEDIKRHNFDFENYGIEKPYQSTFLFQSSGSKVRIPKIETLALHWDFSSLTSSNTTGQFDVNDLSSGSATDGRFGVISDTLSRQHPGRGFSFLTSSARTFDKKSVYNARTQLPEYVNSSDMIFIRDQDDVTFTRSTSPTTFVMTFEKSMYQTVSEEMIKFFSTVTDYGSMVGDRVNEFRLENKHLTKLRQMFFENISNTPKVEKYVDYYRWLDSGINIMLANLMPATAVTFDDENLIRPIIEEYIFNRNKYDHKFPTLEFRQTDPIGHILGIREGLYNYRFGAAPPTGGIENDAQKERCLWWNVRAERDISGSGNTYIDSNRETMLTVRNNLNNAAPPILSGAAGAYSGSTYAIRNFARPYKLDITEIRGYHGGTNFSRNKKLDLVEPIYRRFSTSSHGIRVESSSLLSGSCTDNNELNDKSKVNFTLRIYDHYTAQDDDYVGELAAPYNIVSSSVEQASLTRVNLVNIHNDTYGHNKDTPMQGPFTEKFVGGKPYRHTWNNFDLDNNNINERAEGWQVDDNTGRVWFRPPIHPAAGGANVHLPRSVFYREETAKRPVNIKNIQQKTGSNSDDYTVLGNYHQSHEIVHTSGRKENNRLFAEASGSLLTASSETTFFSGGLDYALPRRDLTGTNKYIIANRFSAPGDPATMGEGFLDVEAGEYSVYNALPWRNLSVRKDEQELLTDHASKGGFFSDWFRLQSYSGSGYAYPGGTGSINQNITTASMGTGSYHKSHRNAILKLKYSNEHVDDNAITNATASHDNYYVRHQIPRSDLQYAWITGSVVSSDNSTYTGSVVYGFEKPDYSNASFASTDLIFVSASDVVSWQRTGVSPTGRMFGTDKKHSDQFGLYKFTEGHIPVDFAYGRSVVVDPVSSSTNTLGVSSSRLDSGGRYLILDADRSGAGIASQPGWFTASYINRKIAAHEAQPGNEGGGVSDIPPSPDRWPDWTRVGGLGITCILNAVLLNRGGPWGGANWKLYKKDNHPIVRAHRAANRISFITSSQLFVKTDVYQTLVGFTSSIEPPINSRYSPIAFDLDIQTSVNGGQTRVVFEQSYLNNFVRFSDKVGDAYDLNDGQAFETVNGYPEKKLAYDTLVELITNNDISKETNPINKVNSITTKETIYPREKNTYLADTRRRTAYRSGFWRDKQETRIEDGTAQPFLSESDGANSAYQLRETASIWNLDARNKFETTAPRSGSGPLLITVRHYHRDDLPADPEDVKLFLTGAESFHFSASDGNSNASGSVGRGGTNYLFAENLMNTINTSCSGHFTASLRISSSGHLSCPVVEIATASAVPSNLHGFTGFSVNQVTSSHPIAWDITASNSVSNSGHSGTFSGSFTQAIFFGGGQHHEGLLQNDAAQFYVTASGLPTSASVPFFGVTGTLYPIYSRRRIEYANEQGGLSKFFLAGDTKYEVAEQANLSPFYDTYDEYISEAAKLGKDYGILPEFRMSEHMHYYLNEKGGNFLAENTASLSLTGAIYHGEDHEGFVVNYKHSDFLKAFNIVNEDFGDKIPHTRIELECEAILKFLPYEGLYPAQRTVQLSKMFMEDYGEEIFYWTGDNKGIPLEKHVLSSSQTIGARPVFAPLFAPGIMFNSIKSGLAVDYPVITSSYGISGSADSTNVVSGTVSDIPRLARVNDQNAATGRHTCFGHRVPFEALVEPLESMGGIDFYDMEPHPYSQLNATASLNAQGRPSYRFAMNNFLATTIDFFRPDGRMATLASAPDDSPDHWIFDKDKKYVMYLYLTNAKNRTYQGMLNKYSALATTKRGWLYSMWKWNEPSVVLYERTGSVDARGSGFGPPVDYLGIDEDSQNGMRTRVSAGPHNDAVYAYEKGLVNFSSASYTSFTPPYYDSFAYAKIEYKPPRDGKIYIDEVLSDLTITHTRFNKFTKNMENTTAAPIDTMFMDSSFNLLQIASQFGVKFSPTGQPLEIDKSTQSKQWVIQPKWESPVLDFKNVEVTLPAIGSGSVARGLWHQYGQIPGAEQGIQLRNAGLDLSFYDSSNHPDALTASLADIVGFKNEPVTIGQIAEEIEIFEAIVAIPHILKDPTDETGAIARLTIPKETIKIAKMIHAEGGLSDKTQNYIDSVGPARKPTTEIVDMVGKMKKYVIPPSLDFVTNDTVNPFAMFIFEFSTVLTQQDLANIWQNLPPQIGTSAQKSKASLPANIFKVNDENGKAMMDIIPDNIQWSVFKVKQRASYNYFTKTADSKDDTRFKFNFEIGSKGAEKKSEPDYSYNWPYDFFSLIELAKVDCKVEFGVPYEPESFPHVVPYTETVPPPEEEEPEIPVIELSEQPAGTGEGQGPGPAPPTPGQQSGGQQSSGDAAAKAAEEQKDTDTTKQHVGKASTAGTAKYGKKGYTGPSGKPKF